VLEAVRALGIGFVAYAPLGRGFLTGTICAESALDETDLRRSFPRFAAGNLAVNVALLNRAEEIAAERQTSSRQVTSSTAASWCAITGSVSVPRGWRSVTSAHIVMGSNNFRSMLLCLSRGSDDISVAARSGVAEWS
jgi:aryl-alcohol dehydrogenase-like predicted oxidoreductase